MKLSLLIIFFLSLLASPAHAVVDPRNSPNNKVGINVLAPHAEVERAKELVNTNGDWGYVVIVIKKSEREVARWQRVFTDLNRAHLIPIVRIATDEDNAGFWQKPEERDAKDWADFLHRLQWPTKNRYVQVYNEVNRAAEWGGEVNPTGYAQELARTIDALKEKNDNFFILNAPLDLALATSGDSLDAAVYMQTMEKTVQGIFNKLDGWASHSYPNPDFSAHPSETHRRSIVGYQWEQAVFTNYTKKDLPVFITETGWRRDPLSDSEISDYYKTAFEKAWSDPNVIAITPFVLNYKDQLFENFSFISSDNQPYDYYNTIKDLEKTDGQPARIDRADIIFEDAPKFLIKDLPRRVYITLLNQGNHIWDVPNDLTIVVSGDNLEAEVEHLSDLEVLPNEPLELKVKLKSKEKGPLKYDLIVKNKENVTLQKTYSLTSHTYAGFIISIIKSAFQ